MKKLLSTVLVLAGAALPAAAQTIYLPYVQNETLGNNQVRTRIWVSNTSDANRLFSTFFLAAGLDGSTVRPELTKIGVAPQGTTIAATSGNIGMLEVTGAPQIRYTGVLETVDGRGQVIGSATLPLIGSENLLAKDVTVFLQGLIKSANRTSGVGIVNLAQTASQCSLTFRQANGTPIGSAALVTVAPLSMRFFSDALGVLGQTALSDARVQVSCNTSYYPFAVTLGTDGSDPAFVGPASTGSSKLSPPGVTPPPPDGSVVFRQDGEFLVARQGDSRIEFKIPVTAGVEYEIVETEFDFFLDRFLNPLFHTVASMRMDGVVWTIAIRADRLKTILDSNVDSINESADWLTKRTYRIRVEANAANNDLFLRIKRGDQVIQDLSMNLGRRRIGTFSENRPLRIDFSQAGVADEGAYWPLIGSRFSNLIVTVTDTNAASSAQSEIEAYESGLFVNDDEGLFELIAEGEDQ
jgi:hypothetical protein